MAHQPNLKAVVMDRIAARLIPGGGMLIVACVLGILVFLAVVAVPLFLPARVTSSVTVPASPTCLCLSFVEGDGNPCWVAGDGVWWSGNGGPATRLAIPGYEKRKPVAAARAGTSLATGVLFDDGRFAILRVEKSREGAIAVAVLDEMDLSRPAPCSICAARDEEGHGRAAILRDGRVTMAGPAGLEGAVETALKMTDADAIALSSTGTLLAVARHTGEVEIWRVEDVSEPVLIQTLPAGPSPRSALAFLLGDETLLTGDERGRVTGWIRTRHVRLTNTGGTEARVLGDVVPAGGSIVVIDREHSKSLPKDGPVKATPGGILFVAAKEFAPLPAAARVLAANPRNKCFAAGDAKGGVRVYHATSERLCLTIPATQAKANSLLSFGSTGEEIAAWDGAIHLWKLSNPHPDVSWSALLAPVWYESYTSKELIWQSSSGTQESEPKYSLWPLFAGTLKGTFYALLFSVPVALAAAIYVARFAPERLRTFVKPAIELMAGIPSVVVGMIAALFFAPILERSLCAVLAGAVLLPFVFGAVVSAGGRVASRPGRIPRAGVELAGASLALLLTAVLALAIGGPAERLFFHGDLRQWLFDTLHVHYDIRNGFIVGVALGFAVIPVIFTIAEDALAGVPASMSSAAVALGATRWQTVRHVVLPAAASGLFAAIVLGIGRAAGETMIVVMAAGNTPIMDPSPWNGMRTLSAAMAIEIPEAPVNGSLYRVLFLTGLLLFAFTASLNTIAELVGTRLRRKYGRV